MLKHLINIKNHQSINFNSLNNVIRYINVKISSSQVHAEFLKIILRKEVLICLPNWHAKVIRTYYQLSKLHNY